MGREVSSIEHEMLKVSSSSLGKDTKRSGRLNQLWGLRGLEPAFPSPRLLLGRDF